MLPAVFTPAEAAKEDAPQIFEEYPGNINTEIHLEFGDVEKAKQEAYYIRTDRLQGQRTRARIYRASLRNRLLGR